MPVWMVLLYLPLPGSQPLPLVTTLSEFRTPGLNPQTSEASTKDTRNTSQEVMWTCCTTILETGLLTARCCFARNLCATRFCVPTSAPAYLLEGAFRWCYNEYRSDKHRLFVSPVPKPTLPTLGCPLVTQCMHICRTVLLNMLTIPQCLL